MPVSESLLQSMGGLVLPAEADEDNYTLTSLDPARDQLLAFFAAAINSELGAAWTAVTNTLGANHKLFQTQPVQDTFPARPTEQFLTQRQSGWPLLCLHRDGRGEFTDYSLERDRLTQPWKLHWIVGPLDIIDHRKMADAGQAVAKILRLAVRQRKHRAYQGGALQFFDDTCALSSIELTGYQGLGQAGFAGDESSTFFWAVEMDLVTTELSDYVDGSEESALDGADLILHLGSDEGILPNAVLWSSDAESGEEPNPQP